MPSILRSLLVLTALSGLALPVQALSPALAPNASVTVDRAGVFDYYVLSLSWSPTFCLTHADNSQCSKGYGFVLHGLWPQYARGGFPQDCYSPERLTPEAVRFGRTIFPAENLIDHEWRKHGTCSGLSALAYFRAADRARTQINVPAPLESPVTTHSDTAAAIARSFVAANPGIPSGSVTVVCSGPQLSEVRLCLNTSLAPVACGKGVTHACRGGPIRIPSVR